MDCKFALTALLVIAFAMTSATARMMQRTQHGCNKACPAHAPASAPAPEMGMVSGAAHHMESAIPHAAQALHGANNPDAWDSAHGFCTHGSMVAADLGPEEKHIVHHLKDDKLKLEADGLKTIVHKSAKFHIRSNEAQDNDIPGKLLEDAFNEIKNSCCSKSAKCLGGWYETGTWIKPNSLFVRIAPSA